MPSRFETLSQEFATTLGVMLNQAVSVVTAGGWQISGEPRIRVVKGFRSLSVNDSPPRITLVAQGGDIITPDLVGGVKIGQARQNIRRLRLFSVKVWCHGANEEQAEQLLHNSIAALDRMAHNSVAFGSEVWEDQSENSDGFERRGTMISFQVVFSVPVFSGAEPLSMAESIEAETDFNGEILACD
jgi:hypothetical protein